jgi:hypothetical protein
MGGPPRFDGVAAYGVDDPDNDPKRKMIPGRGIFPDEIYSFPYSLSMPISNTLASHAGAGGV